MTKKQETVTIEVPLKWATHRSKQGHRGFDTDDEAVNESIRTALEAKKTKLERWREKQHFPWSAESGYVYDSDPREEHRRIANNARPSQARLMAAAPQLLEALIDLKMSVRSLKDAGFRPPTPMTNATKAIESALPSEVADEVTDMICESGRAHAEHRRVPRTVQPKDVAAEVLGE